MSLGECYQAEREMDLKVAERLGQAEARRLARRAKVGQPAWLSWRFRWWLCGLGYRLVALGARLEEFSLSRA
ncbi:MAG TPA: hypothetical protein VLY63_30475 [Anaerolineae bacterium]|nr:hypothetical protein [Anaerolineae bacterium]